MAATSSIPDPDVLSGLIGEPTGVRLVRPEYERLSEETTGALALAAGLDPRTAPRVRWHWIVLLLVVSLTAVSGVWEGDDRSDPPVAAVVATTRVEPALPAPAAAPTRALGAPTRSASPAVPALDPQRMAPPVEPAAVAPRRHELELAGSLYADEAKRDARIDLSGAQRLGERLGANGLTDAVIKQIVGENSASIARCASDAWRRGQPWSGSLNVELEIDPSGAVRNAAIPTEELKGSILADCATRTLARWKFPPFAGETARVSFPYEVAALH